MLDRPIVQRREVTHVRAIQLCDKGHERRQIRLSDSFGAGPPAWLCHLIILAVAASRTFD